MEMERKEKLKVTLWKLGIIVCIAATCTFFCGYICGMQQTEQKYQQQQEADEKLIRRLMQDL